METLVIYIVVAIVIFLIIREGVLWYWRINEAIRILNRIDEKLGQIAANGSQMAKADPIFESMSANRTRI
jgi:hypothetical protein